MNAKGVVIAAAKMLGGSWIGMKAVEELAKRNVKVSTRALAFVGATAGAMNVTGLGRTALWGVSAALAPDTLNYIRSKWTNAAVKNLNVDNGAGVQGPNLPYIGSYQITGVGL